MLERERSSTDRDDATRMAQAVTLDLGANGKFHLKDEHLYDGNTRLDHLYDLTEVGGARQSREFREA